MPPQYGPLEFIRRIRADQLSVFTPEVFRRNLIYNKLLFLHSFLVIKPDYIERPADQPAELREKPVRPTPLGAGAWPRAVHRRGRAVAAPPPHRLARLPASPGRGFRRHHGRVQ